jgi:hypothetical protein
MKFATKDAKYYRTVSDVLEFLEEHVSAESYTLMDGGATLEICSETLAQCRQDEQWQQLEKRYSQIGGAICTQDLDLILELEV